MDMLINEKPDELRELLDDPLFEPIARRVNQRLGLAHTLRSRFRVAEKVRERLGALGGLNLSQYEDNLNCSDEEWARLWEGMAGREGAFFKHPAQYELLADFIDEWSLKGESRKLKVVCFGCGKGHDLYSLVMALKAAGLMTKGWEVDFYGLDLNPKAVAAAQAGLYDSQELAVLEPALVRKWFTPRAGRWWFRQDVVTLKELRAVDSYDFAAWPWPELVGDARIVWARGLSFELTPQAVGEMTQTVGQLLAPGGVLFTAPGEAWPESGAELQPELREGRVYYRRLEEAKMKANARLGGRKKQPSSSRRKPEPPRPDPGFRIRGLLLAAAEKLAPGFSWGAEEAQDFILEALDEAEGQGLFVPEAWALMALKEDILGRSEGAAATAILAASLAPWAPYPRLVAERLLLGQERSSEAEALNSRIETDRNEFKEPAWATDWAGTIFSLLGY